LLYLIENLFYVMSAGTVHYLISILESNPVIFRHIIDIKD